MAGDGHDGSDRHDSVCFWPVFDERPIEIGGFSLRGTTVVVLEDRPSFDGWQTAMHFAQAAERSSPFWVGDLLAYAKSREDWKQRMEHAEAVTRLTYETLENRATVSRKIQGRARDLAPSLSHAAVVTSLEPDEQEELLEQAATERWTVRELRQAKKNRERLVRAEGRAPTMHTVEVTVRLTREAETPALAEDLAWRAIKAAVAGVPHAHVIAAKAWPTVGPTRVVKGRRTATA